VRGRLAAVERPVAADAGVHGGTAARDGCQVVQQARVAGIDLLLPRCERARQAGVRAGFRRRRR
jgi:hypothetical protein